MPQRPLVLVPGAGLGLASFLPLVLFLQRRYRRLGEERMLVVYRLPWVEVGRPWSHWPQWGEVVEDMREDLTAVLGPDTTFDVIAHSYGTAVANRLLRSLCVPKEASTEEAERARTAAGHATNVEPTKGLRIHFLAILDPIILGSASCGLVGVINYFGPDLSFAFCANRAGVSFKEILDYDPAQFGQCCGGLGVYMTVGDVLLDIDLAHFVLERNVRSTCTDVAVDTPRHGVHSRWLVELWFTAGLGPRLGGLLPERMPLLGCTDRWVAPCTGCLLELLSRNLERQAPEAA